MKPTYATLRVDALGIFTALALTLSAGVVAVGPQIVARGPSPADQKAELERRRSEATAQDRLVETTRQRLAELTTRTEAAVHLQPVTRVNERLVEITKLAAVGNIAIAQMTPGAPAAPAPAATTPADKPSASPASPLDGKALIVPIKLAGTGSYPDLARFLHSLRETFRDTAITTLKLTAQPALPNSAKSSENVPAAFTIDLAWYAAPAGSADAPANP